MTITSVDDIQVLRPWILALRNLLGSLLTGSWSAGPCGGSGSVQSMVTPNVASGWARSHRQANEHQGTTAGSSSAARARNARRSSVPPPSLQLGLTYVGEDQAPGSARCCRRRSATDRRCSGSSITEGGASPSFPTRSTRARSDPSRPWWPQLRTCSAGTSTGHHQGRRRRGRRHTEG
jgi:hypothetical protein